MTIRSPLHHFSMRWRANSNTDLYLLPCEDESVVLEILEVLGSRKRWLVVPIPEWSQKRFGSGPGGLKHCLLSAEHCRFFRKHGPENALNQRRDRQTLDILPTAENLTSAQTDERHDGWLESGRCQLLAEKLVRSNFDSERQLCAPRVRDIGMFLKAVNFRPSHFVHQRAQMCANNPCLAYRNRKVFDQTRSYMERYKTHCTPKRCS